jgi:hypothetical protein
MPPVVKPIKVVVPKVVVSKVTTGLPGPRGRTGPQGTPGSEWFYGEGAPAPELGVDDDLYLQSEGTVWKKLSGTWTNTGINLSAAGGGDVTGPSSATNNSIALFDETTGKLLKSSVVVVDGDGNISGIGNITLSGTVDGRDIATDGSKLDGIESGAEVNTVDSVNGQTGVVVLDADDISDATTTNKFTNANDISKLAGIQAGATANSADSFLLDRANHTGTQAISTITDLQTTLDAKMPKIVQVTKTINTGDWSLVSGLYEADIADAAITANSVVDVIPNNADIDTVRDAEILPRTDSSSGSVKVYAVNLPTASIGVTLSIGVKT